MRRAAAFAVATVSLIGLTVDPAMAQEASLVSGLEGSLTSRSIQLFLLLTVISLAPGIAIMITCFPFLVTVFSILRQGLGLQNSPPNMLLISLAMFLTYFVMEPVFTAAWEQGITPMLEEQITADVAFERTMDPFRMFMSNRMDPDTYTALASLRPDAAETQPGPDAPLSVLIPSFMLSEMSRAFQIGFLIFLPFLIIDLVVAAVLMSMGMMMVPPAIVSLPFKLSFFVLADGWSLIAGALVRSYF
ncbi:flagellar type III secretion system pore protein FliP [Shimia haliotis]|uniref:Flagellar biosynthetic protein FliP n=1 Tax=Shimia haliotis TaxID=1280847 RepID=A0A1I4DE61_9RHOB|nr:flagellar type III secretion system pore protein FliP [Shimia haliotis]SFK91293.1 flagellar biosynthetic protein FliP [Shimia haliotis]